MNNFFGTYWTKKFSDFWVTSEAFLQDWKEAEELSKMDNEYIMKDESVKTLFFLLYAQYGNSHIANMDENQFKIKLWSIMYQYGPAWEKKTEYQNKIRHLTDEELVTGAKSIYNHSYNPSSAPSTSSLSELPTIDDQNTNNYKKAKIEAFYQASQYLQQDFTKIFLDKFKKLFLLIVEPQLPLLYESEE